MKVLVIGGNGFIGSHVVDTMLSAGHSVNVYDRSPEIWRLPIPDVNYFYGDFSDTTYLAKALYGIDAVIHLLSTTVPSTSNLNPIADVNDNLISTLHLLEMMVANNVNRILFLSSAGTVYGNTKTRYLSQKRIVLTRFVHMEWLKLQLKNTWVCLMMLMA